MDWGALATFGGSLGGSLLSDWSNKRASNRNADIQREFAKNGIRWRVADAKAAGINPLAALGANMNPSSPVAVGTDFGDLGLGKVGQDISRAMGSKMTKEERDMHELKKQLLQTQIEGQRIDNANNAKNIGTPPPMPDADFKGTPGDVARTGISVVPDQVTAAKQTGVTAGTHALYTDAMDENGITWRMPNKDFADVLESSFPMWVRHNITEAVRTGKSWLSIFMDKKYKPILAKQLRKVRPPSPRKGWEYRWDAVRSAWRLDKMDGQRTHLFHYWDRRETEKRYKIERN